MDKGRDMVVDIDTAVVGKGRVVDTDKVVDMMKQIMVTISASL